MRIVTVIILIAFLAVSCEKFEENYSQPDCGSLTISNLTGCELMIEVDVSNTTYHLYPGNIEEQFNGWSGDQAACVIGQQYQAYIMIDGREWVFLQSGVMRKINVFDLPR